MLVDRVRRLSRDDVAIAMWLDVELVVQIIERMPLRRGRVEVRNVLSISRGVSVLATTS